MDHITRLVFICSLTGSIYRPKIPVIADFVKISIAALAIDNAPHTPSRIVTIAIPSRDEMNVDVKHGLPGRLTIVHPDVKTSD